VLRKAPYQCPFRDECVIYSFSIEDASAKGAKEGFY
jgi:hypothetical protein